MYIGNYLFFKYCITRELSFVSPKVGQFELRKFLIDRHAHVDFNFGHSLIMFKKCDYSLQYGFFYSDAVGTGCFVF
jgi:hypothetical protein